MSAPFWIDPAHDDRPFPQAELALREPDGLLAVGGDLSPTRLITAYRQGIFPWYSDGQPILWWSPDPRAVLFPKDLKVSRSLRKTIRKKRFKISLDTAFAEVIDACAQQYRKDQQGTWITPQMRAAYLALHERGVAHSVEAWLDGQLAGGLYGVALGQVFFGESMFARVTDASKVAFVHLVRQLQAWGFPLIDCQVQTGHLSRLGATLIPRRKFLSLLQHHANAPAAGAGPWRLSDTVRAEVAGE